MGLRINSTIIWTIVNTRNRQRKTNRLQRYDYSQTGWYFITICTRNRVEYFGIIEKEEMILNENGNLVKQLWMGIPKHFSNVKLDEYIVMPNHLHGIIVIDNEFPVWNAGNVGNCKERRSAFPTTMCSLQNDDRSKMLVSKIIHGFKSSVTRQIRKQYNNYSFAWQKSFYDHIIRNERSLQNIREYIQNNPLKWAIDKNNIENLYM